MTYNLKNPLLVEGLLGDCTVDLQLPRELLQQMKLELKRAAITLKDIQLDPAKPSVHAMQINADYSCNIFIAINCVHEQFTAQTFADRLNTEFKKIFPKHTLISLGQDNLKLNLLAGQKMFTPNHELLQWLLPDFANEILTYKQVKLLVF